MFNRGNLKISNQFIHKASNHTVILHPNRPRFINVVDKLVQSKNATTTSTRNKLGAQIISKPPSGSGTPKTTTVRKYCSKNEAFFEKINALNLINKKGILRLSKCNQGIFEKIRNFIYSIFNKKQVYLMRDDDPCKEFKKKKRGGCRRRKKRGCRKKKKRRCKKRKKKRRKRKKC